MGALTSRTSILIGLSVLYAAAVVPIASHNGADFENHLPHIERLIAGQPPYAEPAAVGLWWPPLALFTLTPFALMARLSLPLAKGAFALVGVACLAWTLLRFEYVRGAQLTWAIAAVAVPLETNFEWLNWNTVLLALIVAATLDLSRNRDVRAGVWLGIATALKVFPALLLLFAAYRGRWRTAISGASVALMLSLLALLPLGIPGAIASGEEWLTQSNTGAWVLVRRNQSLLALLGRAGIPHPWALAADLALVGVAALVLRRSSPGHDLEHDLAIVTLLAVIVSPIAWIHYYFLALPAWIGVIARAPAARPPWVRTMLVVAAVATSGLLTVWSYPSRVVLQMHSLFAWGGLLLLAVLLVERLQQQTAGPAPSLT
ncbi:MAG TPA: glycosyltransferase family 87 protein [Gemmatimonadales bacterium]|nr:glycosyltransferase family 87 protein [Gemmatimonadales bacterium]